MTKLAKAAAEYVALRRALGFKMVEVSHRLADFVEFARREARFPRHGLSRRPMGVVACSSPAGHVGNPVGDRPAVY